MVSQYSFNLCVSCYKSTWLPFLFLRTICISFSVNYVFIITWLFSFSFFKNIYYLFDFLGSYLWHVGSLLPCAGSFLVSRELKTCGIVLWLGIEPMAPALQGKILTIRLSGKSCFGVVNFFPIICKSSSYIEEVNFANECIYFQRLGFLFFQISY